MVAAAGLPDQLEVPLHLAPLALGIVAGEAVGLGIGAVVDAPALGQQGFIFAVGHNGLVQFLGKHHGLTHPLLRLDAPAVVGKAGHVGGHGGKVRQLCALLAPGDGAVGIDVDPGAPVNGPQLLT